ncbi:MAG: M3 family oligoendopeptidase [Ignavibacteria bacterium]|nr:M3 family oligoendopeptidase [Ignavibacteria bacterium]
MSELKFSQLPYSRPKMDEIHTRFEAIEEVLQNGSSAQEQIDAIKTWNELRLNIMTMGSLAEVHFSLDVANEKNKEEKHFYDENGPTIMEWNTDISRLIIHSSHLDALKKEFGELLFIRLENELMTFSPAIKELLIQESDLNMQYNEITASAKIEVRGTEYNLSSIGKLMISEDREVRKEAVKAQYDFLLLHASEFDNIYHELVQLRDKKAKLLGFKNYIDLRYIEMGRVDYNASDVAKFRQQVIEYIIPIASRLRASQAKRLGLTDGLHSYDEKLQFADGNPIAHGDHDFIVSAATTMYTELSGETKEFFNVMLDRQLMDLDSRNNKSTGGYCTSFPEYGVPFIFANFNKTTHDVEVLTHEAGHAFQAYRSRLHKVPEYQWPTAEACEIHSMAMEFLTWPWMDKFFEDDAEKFKFYHLQGAIIFLPYACAIDHFQHWVYENPNVTPAERLAQWREMEKLYLPWRNNEGIEGAMQGRAWQFQRHVYEGPFYYIDYALAQTCALQYWNWSQEDRAEAFKSYLKICDVGGSVAFLDIVKVGGLKSPFTPGTLEDIVESASAWLSKEHPEYLK